MALVSYSDSEGSGDETPHQPPPKAATSALAQPTEGLQPLTDKSQPRKIKVDFSGLQPDPLQKNGSNAEPPAKRQRLGGGGFSDFKSMLPAPKRSGPAATQTPTSKGAPRKVFGLKTGAEPGFDRSADEELRQLFGEQEKTTNGVLPAETVQETNVGRSISAVPSPSMEPPRKGNAMMFKPLSVSRNPQKKKKPVAAVAAHDSETQAGLLSSSKKSSTTPALAPKTSLFSLFKDAQSLPSEAERSGEYENIIYDGEQNMDGGEDDFAEESTYPNHGDVLHETGNSNGSFEPQSLDTIANDLNLSASAKRQLLGRNAGKSSTNAINVVNFNTDQEYAANEALRANGEQVQSNPVRAIAPGKHSLRQLVTAASGQMEALEESFAAGRRNRKEAGSKYGW
ncbi:MAG: hypothetical protein Q9160_009046 [Pyrenula sp. 1 TL-2023]